jgi:hypothetical protein
MAATIGFRLRVACWRAHPETAAGLRDARADAYELTEA